MPLIIIATILWIIFFVKIVYEPRKFSNAIMLIFNIFITMVICAMKPGIASKILGIFIIMSPLCFLVIAVFLLINGIAMIRKEGHYLQNLLSLFTGIAMILGAIMTVIGLYYLQDESIMRSVFYLLVIIELYIAISFISLLIYSLLYTYIPKRINCDYIIVHGCGLTKGEVVSPLLKDRVDKAVKIYNKSKGNVKIVVSGGKGDDEKISEAQAMKNYLLQTKFPEEKIIMEDNSKTTFENLQNVRDMLDVDSKKNKYIFVTNNYHVFRTSLFTKKLKMKAVGVGCKTAGYYWPSAFIREYIAIMVKYKWTFALIVIIWALVEVGIYIK